MYSKKQLSQSRVEKIRTSIVSNIDCDTMSTVAVVRSSQVPWNPALHYQLPHESENDKYPEIKAGFSLENYLLREAMLAARFQLRSFLPKGFPQWINSPAVWSSKTLVIDDIIVRASSDDIKELEKALKLFKGDSND